MPRRGKTVIFSTHVMSEVEKLCDSIGIIHSGKLLAEARSPNCAQNIRNNDLEEIFVEGGRAAVCWREEAVPHVLAEILAVIYRKN